MGPASVPAFIEILERDHFLDFTQLDELKKSLAPCFTDPKTLARELIKREWLSPYQVNQILTGKAHELVLEPYLILERLGEGVMGQVFKARHQTMRRVVALKIIHRRLVTDPEVVQWFYHEVAAASQLTHPNVVHAYDAGPIGDTHFLAMEHVDGVDLEKRVKQNGPLPIAEACDLIRQVAHGLQAIANCGLVHRDLKPANILLAKKKVEEEASSDSSASSISSSMRSGLSVTAASPYGRAKILDLGLARLQRAGPDSSVSGSALVGTADFVSPEQALDPEQVDIRSDLYSLGCTFYYLLTGQPPFPEGNWMTKLRKHATEDPIPVEERRRGVPPPVAAVVRRLLAKQREQRFQAPAELANVMTSILSTGNWPKHVNADVPTPASAAFAEADIARRLAQRYTPRRQYPWSRFRLPKSALARFATRKNAAIAGGALLVLLLLSCLMFWPASKPPPEKKKGTGSATNKKKDAPPRAEGVLVRVFADSAQESAFKTLHANGYPNLSGTWYHMGPWDNDKGKGFATAYPPEKGIDFNTNHTGKGNVLVSWKPFKDFKIGAVNDLRVYPHNDHVCTYLYHSIDAPRAMSLPISLGSDDTITVWLNGKKLLANKISRGVAPDQDHVTLKLKRGKNELLIKICNGSGDFAVYVAPQLPGELKTKVIPTTPAALIVQCGRENGAQQDEKLEPGYSYLLRNGTLFSGWNDKPVKHCWYDQASLRFDVKTPKGVAGMLHLRFVDADSAGRRQTLTVAGRELGEFENFQGLGKFVIVPITSEDSKNGTIPVQIDNLNPDINAVVSVIKFFPDKK